MNSEAECGVKEVAVWAGCRPALVGANPWKPVVSALTPVVQTADGCGCQVPGFGNLKSVPSIESLFPFEK